MILRLLHCKKKKKLGKRKSLRQPASADFEFSQLLVLKGYSIKRVTRIIPPCHSNSLKALFVFGTQFKIF